MPVLESVRTWARRLKRDAVALWFASRNPRTPLLAKIVCIIAVAYALSPVDLIPDFIPVLGYFDDVLLVPALLWLSMRLMPADVMHASRLQAEQWMAANHGKPRSRAGAFVIVLIWLLALGLCLYWTRGYWM